MTDISATDEGTVGSGEQSGFSDARSGIGSGLSDAFGGSGGGVVSGAETAGEDSEAGVASFLGGGLEKAYLLILPPAIPAGGPASAADMAEAAAETSASVATQDLAGNSIDDNSDVMAAEAQTVGVTAVRLDFAFNPTRYNISKSANWTHMPDKGSYPTATPQWVGSSQRTLSLEIFLDASYTTSGSVQGAVDLLFATLQPTRPSLLMDPSPPFVLFGWGENIAFLAYMESVSAEFTHFRSDGTPLRATCQISMKEIPVMFSPQNPTSGGRARNSRQIVSGDSLASVSHRELGKPTLWRAIAETNNIEDPTRVRPGTNLLIPPRSDAAELA